MKNGPIIEKEYANIILLQEGFISNAYIGYALHKKENSLNGIYISFGLGILQHRINIETKNQYIPQLSSEYKKAKKMKTESDDLRIFKI